MFETMNRKRKKNSLIAIMLVMAMMVSAFMNNAFVVKADEYKTAKLIITVEDDKKAVEGDAVAGDDNSETGDENKVSGEKETTTEEVNETGNPGGLTDLQFIGFLAVGMLFMAGVIVLFSVAGAKGHRDGSGNSKGRDVF